MNSVEQNPNETETPAATGIRLCGAKIDEETTYHDAMAGSHVSTILYVSIILLIGIMQMNKRERLVEAAAVFIHGSLKRCACHTTELTF